MSPQDPRNLDDPQVSDDVSPKATTDEMKRTEPTPASADSGPQLPTVSNETKAGQSAILGLSDADITMANDNTTGPEMVTSRKQSPKKLALIIVAAILGLAVIGSGIAFAIWNYSPDKVLGDALSNMMKDTPKAVSGDMSIVSSANSTSKFVISTWSDNKQNSQANVTIEVSSESGTAKVSVDAIAAENGDVYIKLNDARKLVEQITAGDPTYAAMFDGLLEKIDSKWVKITKDDIKELTGDSESADSKCLSSAIESFQKDQAQQKEVSDIYQKNRFVTVKSKQPDEKIDGRDSYHYVLDSNKNKAKSFGDGIKSTAIYKKVKDCLGDSFKEDTSSTDDSDSDGSVDVWIDKASRRITKLSFDAKSVKEKSSVKLNAVMGYDTKAVSIPSSPTTIKELQQELQALYGGYASSSSSSTQITIEN